MCRLGINVQTYCPAVPRSWRPPCQPPGSFLHPDPSAPERAAVGRKLDRKTVERLIQAQRNAGLLNASAARCAVCTVGIALPANEILNFVMGPPDFQ